MKPRPILPLRGDAPAGPGLSPGRQGGASWVPRRLARVLALPVALTLTFAAPSAALADLMLYPTRIVISGTQRSAQVEIVNRGETPETYRITLVNRRMNEAGDIVPADVAEAGERFAETMVVYSPRQVTLQPGQSQTVRVSVRRPADLAEGEYRSHLQFERQPEVGAQNNLENIDNLGGKQVSVSLEALIGASIPVIIRQGPTQAQVSLGDLSLAPATGGRSPLLSFVFRREGNQSVYGDVVATFTPDGGKAVEVGRVSGVAVYVPNAIRRTQLSLRPPAGLALSKGVLRLTYSEQASAGGRRLAEARIDLP